MKQQAKCLPTQRHCRCKDETDSDSIPAVLKFLTPRSEAVMSLILINVWIPYFPWHLSSIQHHWASFSSGFHETLFSWLLLLNLLQRLDSHHLTIKGWSFSRFIPGTLLLPTLSPLFRHWHLHLWLQLPSVCQRFKSPAQTSLVGSWLMYPII